MVLIILSRISIDDSSVRRWKNKYSCDNEYEFVSDWQRVKNLAKWLSIALEND